MFCPNPGSLYAGLADLNERSLAAVKSLRGFEADSRPGLPRQPVGEREWLTHDKRMLQLPPARRTETLWARAANKSWPVRASTLMPSVF